MRRDTVLGTRLEPEGGVGAEAHPGGVAVGAALPEEGVVVVLPTLILLGLGGGGGMDNDHKDKSGDVCVCV